MRWLRLKKTDPNLEFLFNILRRVGLQVLSPCTDGINFEE